MSELLKAVQRHRKATLGFNENQNVETMWNGFECDICGEYDIYGPSKITLEANYGSKHDGDLVTLNVCGDCMDWLFDSIVEQAGKPTKITHW